MAGRQKLTCVIFSQRRYFMFKPQPPDPPRLVLIAGCTGTGKSTFGMNIALSEGIMKCVSTDTIRQVLRTFDTSDAVHRSSYSGSGDPSSQWLETASSLQPAIISVVDDAIKRGNSLVLEGVHIVPSGDIIDRWRKSNGLALGVLLVITDEEAHRKLIYRRGKISKKGAAAQLEAFTRIREIQRRMIEKAKILHEDWIIVEQQLEPDPADIVNDFFCKKI